MKSIVAIALLMIAQSSYAGYPRDNTSSMSTKPIFGAMALFLFGTTRIMQRRQQELRTQRNTHVS